MTDPQAFRNLMRPVDTPFGRIACADVGEGRPLLLLHGFPLNAAHWRGVVAELHGERRCVAPDLMGLGATEVDDSQDLGFTAQAQMVLSLADALGIERFDLVGNDSGGAVAQIVAATRPDRVLSLTLTNCDVDENVPPPAFQQVHAMACSGMLADMMGQLLTDIEMARSDFGLGIGFADREFVTPELVQTYLGPSLATPARRSRLNRYVAAFEPRHTVAVRDALRSLTVPVQVLWGDADVFFTTEDADWLVRNIPSVRRRVDAPGGRLFFPEERPAWVAARLREFLS